MSTFCSIAIPAGPISVGTKQGALVFAMMLTCFLPFQSGESCDGPERALQLAVALVNKHQTSRLFCNNRIFHWLTLKFYSPASFQNSAIV
jgi:hypothetical protein